MLQDSKMEARYLAMHKTLKREVEKGARYEESWQDRPMLNLPLWFLLCAGYFQSDVPNQ